MSNNEETLLWALKFMDKYERKHKIRTEEPLKGYRQEAMDILVERAKKNGVI